MNARQVHDGNLKKLNVLIQFLKYLKKDPANKTFMVSFLGPT